MTNKCTKMRWYSKICICFWVFLLCCTSCSKNTIERNPYIPNLTVNYQLNLRFPSNNKLNFAGGGLLINDIGLNGVLVFNLSGNSFLAWEATCPNHSMESCSALKLEGVLAVCSCESYQYSLATGQLLNPSRENNTPYNLLFYQIRKIGDVIYISN